MLISPPKTLRNAEIMRLWARGSTMVAIGRLMGIHPTRVRQIVQRLKAPA